jgi:hypothetical protein
MSVDPVFDFSKAEPVVEDVVVRLWLDDDTWIDVMHTAGGHEAPWNWSPTIATAEEAKRIWLKTRAT